MSYKVKKNTITLTRGDTFKATVKIVDSEGAIYYPAEKDIIEFACKKNYKDEEYLIHKIVDPYTLILTLNPEDTKSIPYGLYVWDMQITKVNGEVDTFITNGLLIITEEVV